MEQLTPMQTFYMDGYLKSNLDIAKTVIKKDWDMMFAIDGAEGSGKSVLAMQIAYYCDPTLNLDRIVFTPNSFRKAIVNAKPFEAIVYDEAYTGLSSRATMSLINRTLIKMLAEIRQKNLFIFVVMPTFFDLDKYVALWRSRALIHVYVGNNFERGYFAFFNVDKKKDLYIYGKKFYNYNKVKANFIGRFSKYRVLEEELYKQKKRSALVDREKAAEEAEIMRHVENAIFERFMTLPDTLKDKISNRTIAELLGIGERALYYRIQKWNEGREFA